MRAVAATRAWALLAGGVLGLLWGCASSGLRPDEVERWVGRPATALEKAWGPATREVPDQGLRLLVYEELENRRAISTQGGGTSTRSMQSSINTQANATAYPPQVYTRSYLFWVDTAGTIVRTDTRGGQ
jgi:hypothetical protein